MAAGMPVVLVYEDAAAVTPSDASADPAGPFASLLVTGAGTVKLHTLVGTDVSLAAVVVGQVSAFRAGVQKVVHKMTVLQQLAQEKTK